MFIAPVMLLPYVMFRAWLDIMLGTPSEHVKPPVRDPLSEKGAGSASHAALNVWAVKPDAPSIELPVAKPTIQLREQASRRKH